MEAIVSIITNLGFPIACVICLGYFVYLMWNKTMEETNKREERYVQQIDKFGDSLNKFNETLIRIDSRLEQLEKTVSKNYGGSDEIDE